MTVLGYGSIGRALAVRLLACGAVVTAVASAPRSDDLVGSVVTAADVDWAAQHVVVVVLPLTASTRHVVDAAFLAGLSDGCLVVNVGRGPLLDTVRGDRRGRPAALRPRRHRPRAVARRPPALVRAFGADHPARRGRYDRDAPADGRPVAVQLTAYVAGQPLRNLV